MDTPLFRSARSLLGALAMACAMLAPAAHAQQPAQAGREFVRVASPQPVATGEKIELIEFFYYGCPVCYEAQPHLSRWLVGAPDYVAIRRVPAVFSESSENFARLFYTLEAVGELQRLHWPVYDNFHFDGVKLNDEKVMLDWVARNRIDRDKFAEIYKSDEVKARVEAARALNKSFDVRGVPTFVVDGKYQTSARLSGGTRQVMQVVDQLVKQSRVERPAR